MDNVAQVCNCRQRACSQNRAAANVCGGAFGSIFRFRSVLTIWMITAIGLSLLAAPVRADFIIEPITWDVVGLDHNRPETSGPQYFPVGVRVRNTGASSVTNVEVSMDWATGSDATYIKNRDGSLTTLSFDEIPVGQYVDAYFEIQLTRTSDAFTKSREYTITATETGNPSNTASTPAGRQIYVEGLVSQNRNTTTSIRYGQDKNNLQLLGGGATLALAVGETYFIELVTQTSTAYEEIQSFLTLSNTIFQVLAVETTYGDQTAPVSRVPDPNPSLWGDGCLWDSDPDSPNYNSCLSSGKVGGVVTTLYQIKIISGGGDSVGLEALIYDRSGGSFHYNTDFSQSPGEIKIVDPADASFAKRFVPGTIGADGVATLRFTITNPNPVTVSGYDFEDTLPGAMVVAPDDNASSTCIGTITANPGEGSIAFADGVIGPNSSCTILVDVTVPFDINETYPLDLDNSVDLYVGDAEDPSAEAEADLEVLAEEPPPLVCDYFTDESIAVWGIDTFLDSNNPNHPPTGPTGGVGVGTAAGVTTSVSNKGQWRMNSSDLGNNATLLGARNNNHYFEFVINTTGIDYVNLALTVSRQNNSAADSVTLDYGTESEFTQDTQTQNAQTWTGISTTGTPVLTASNLTNLNPIGNTLFRFYVYNSSGNNNYFFIHGADFTGTGAVSCEPLDENETPPVSPSLSKTFSPEQISVGATSTLEFVLENPNLVNVLTGVTFRDELPAGMTVVSGSFVNNCSIGSSWGLDGTDPDVLEFTGGTLAANSTCTLTVDVISTAIGDNLNLSDPIDSRETYPGNTTQDTLEVLPPPALPSIQKLFDPNPLLTPSGSTKLTFRITNNDPDLDIESVAFTDVLPLVGSVQMIPDDDPFAYTTNGNCGGSHSFTWDSGTSTLTFDDGEISAGAVCELYVDVKVPGVDVSGGEVLFPNETSTVSHIFNDIQYEGNTASATLLVDNPIPGISILKQVGLTDDPEGVWFTNLIVTPGTRIYYYIIVENTGEVELSSLSVTDPDVSLTGCTWTSPLPVASADNDNHVTACIVGVVDPGIVAIEGEDIDNTATATGTYETTNYIAESTAQYSGVNPTAVKMGNVELASINVSDFLGGINVPALDTAGLLNLLRAWDPDAAEGLEGARRDPLLAALSAYLDPDGDGQIVVLRWETLEERGTVGFYAERWQGGDWVKINAEMLPGLIAAPMGAQYWLADPGARPGDGYQYRLIEVEARGTTREYGPFDLRVGK